VPLQTSPPLWGVWGTTKNFFRYFVLEFCAPHFEIPSGASGNQMPKLHWFYVKKSTFEHNTDKILPVTAPLMAFAFTTT